MISIEVFSAMPDKDKSNFIMDNFPINNRSSSFRKSVYGHGVNDSDYITQPVVGDRQLRCPAYRSWARVLERCFSDKLKARRPTYKNTTLSDKWIRFSSFREWWIDHQVDGFDIDKDIIGDGSEYSPEKCIFIPVWLNSFVALSDSARGKYAIGVHMSSKGRLSAQCNHPFGGQQHLGQFDMEIDAYNAWLKRKLEIALELKPKMDEIDERIYHGVVRIIKNAR